MRAQTAVWAPPPPGSAATSPPMSRATNAGSREPMRNPHHGQVVDELSATTLYLALKRQHISTTTHGFRTSFRSWRADTRVPHDIAEFALAHAISNNTVTAYQRSDLFEARQQVMQDSADYLAR